MAPAESYMSRSLLFYSKYHSNHVNKAIHFVFVPALSLSALIILAYLPPISSIDLEGAHSAPGWLLKCEVAQLNL